MVGCFSAPACAGFSSISRTSLYFRLLIVYRLIRRYRFYGINLNQNVVLQQIGYDGSTGTPWNRLFKISTGGMIITALGFVPGKDVFVHFRELSPISNETRIVLGYYVTVLTIEKLGRKWIQIQGFLMAALFR